MNEDRRAAFLSSAEGWKSLLDRYIAMAQEAGGAPAVTPGVPVSADDLASGFVEVLPGALPDNAPQSVDQLRIASKALHDEAAALGVGITALLNLASNLKAHTDGTGVPRAWRSTALSFAVIADAAVRTAVAIVREGDKPAVDHRVTFDEAVAGVPAFGLPPTPETTLRRWHTDPAAAHDLGVDVRGKASLQLYRVDALLALQRRKATNRSRPPSKPATEAT